MAKRYLFSHDPTSQSRMLSYSRWMRPLASEKCLEKAEFSKERGSKIKTFSLGSIYPKILRHKPIPPANIPHSLDHLVHLAKFLGHFRVVRAILVATVIHTQEVSNQHIPFTTVHCERKNTKHGGLRPTPQPQPSSDTM